MVWEWLSSLWLRELQGFSTPKKWTIFALWPNLREQNDNLRMFVQYQTDQWVEEGAKKEPQGLLKLYRPLTCDVLCPFK